MRFKRRHPIKDRIVDAWLCSAMLIRREAFDRVGIFDEDRSTSPDIDWLLRAKEAGLRVDDAAPRRIPEAYPYDEPQRHGLRRRKPREARRTQAQPRPTPGWMGVVRRIDTISII